MKFKSLQSVGACYVNWYFLKVGWLQVCSKIVYNILHALIVGQARANFPCLIAMFRLQFLNSEQGWVSTDS